MYTLRKPVRSRFKRRRVEVPALYHANLVDALNLKLDTNETTFLLKVMDMSLKQELLASVTQTTLQTDKDTYFFNQPCQNMLKDRGIQHLSTHNKQTKMNMVESFNRPMKTRIGPCCTNNQSR